MTLSFSVSPGRVLGAFAITVVILVLLLPVLVLSSPMSGEHLIVGVFTAVNVALVVRILQRLDWIENDLDQVLEQTRGERTA